MKIIQFIKEIISFFKIEVSLKIKNKIIFIPHAERCYDELNGKTSLTKDIILNINKKIYYPFLLHAHKNEQYDIRLFERIFKYIPVLKKNFNHNLIAIRQKLLKKKFKINDINKFIKSRSKFELIFFKKKNFLFFHHTAPLATGLAKWIFFVENPLTIFHPFLIQHKLDKQINIRKLEFYKLIKNHIMDKNCKKILVNYHHTKKAIPKIFNNKNLENKIVYFRQGTKDILNYDRIIFFREKNDQLKNRNIHFLFVNSFNHQEHNFYCRGGKFLFKTFEYIKKKYPKSRLTICSKVPLDLEPLIKKDKNINYITNWITKKKWVNLFKSSHFLISPGIGGFTETNLHCMMNGTILIGGNHFINRERFGKRFILIKSLDNAINYKTIKNFGKIPDYNFFFKDSCAETIGIDITKSLTNFINQKNYLNFIEKNYQEYLSKFNFKNSIKDFNKYL